MALLTVTSKGQDLAVLQKLNSLSEADALFLLKSAEVDVEIVKMKF